MPTSSAPAEEAFVLGRTMQDLQEQQCAAVRAVNFQDDEGRWLSAEAPPRASADIQVCADSVYWQPDSANSCSFPGTVPRWSDWKLYYLNV